MIVMDRLNEEFGRRVREELGSRGLSLRQTRIRTGIDIDTVGRMRQGDVPRLDKVENFARALGLDVNEWRALAGYATLSASDPNPSEYLFDAIRELQERYPRWAGRVPRFTGSSAALTLEEAERIIADLRIEAESA